MSARAWAAFATVSTLWGIPYLFIKIAVDDGVPPAFLAFVRVALGAAVLLGLAWRAGTLGRCAAAGAGSRSTRCSRSRCLPAHRCGRAARRFVAGGDHHRLGPLFVALLALRFDPAERATGSRLVGLVVGLAGVVALVGIDVAGRGDELLGAGAILLAAVGYAAGPMVFKRTLADLDPRAAMGASLVDRRRRPRAARRGRSAHRRALGAGARGARRARALLHRGGVRLLRRAHRRGRPRRGLVITYVAPVVAVTLGVTVLGERPGAGAVAGLLLILAGSWLSTDGRLPPPLVAVVTRLRARRGERVVERRSHPMNAPSGVDAVLDNRRRLEELHRERMLAQMTPLAGEPAYMADLEDEILATEAAYVAGGSRRSPRCARASAAASGGRLGPPPR